MKQYVIYTTNVWGTKIKLDYAFENNLDERISFNKEKLQGMTDRNFVDIDKKRILTALDNIAYTEKENYKEGE